MTGNARVGAPVRSYDVDADAAAVWAGNGTQDRVRWGPVWAGLLTALGTFLLLTTAAVAIGALAVDSGASADDSSAASGIASAIIALLAFLVGGDIAGRSARVLGRGYGALHGF